VFATQRHPGIEDCVTPSPEACDLTRINLDDLVTSFGWQDRPLLARLSNRLFAAPATTFARQMAQFDDLVGQSGLVNASRTTLRHFVKEVRVFNPERIPRHGFVALSNHPGLCDALSLFSALDRPDLRIIAAQRPFLAALPNTSRHLSYLADDSSSRVALIRQVGAHLRRGGAVLTFPAGRIEPDPDRRAGAAAALAAWSSSAGALVRLAPDAAILPALVRGVVWPPADQAWLAGWSTTTSEREKRAAALQLLAHTVLKVRSGTVRVQIGQPVYAGSLGTRDPRAIHAAVVAEMAELISQPPQGEGVSLPIAP
jgi:1-acyl-sn-glycerol-3-phosphate acyltransferase